MILEGMDEEHCCACCIHGGRSDGREHILVHPMLLVRVANSDRLE